jgi:hypothetical protein
MSKPLQWERYIDPFPAIIPLAYFHNAKKIKIEETSKRVVTDKLTSRPKYQYRIRVNYSGKKKSFTKYYDNKALNQRQKIEAFKDILGDAIIYASIGGATKLAERLHLPEKYANKLWIEFEKTYSYLDYLFGADNIQGIFSEMAESLKT